MVKYAKSKRTIDRGLRLSSVPSSESFSQTAIAKMAEIIEGILTDNQILDERAKWIVEQALLASAFREAATNEERNEAMKKIKKHRDVGHSLSFSETDIGAINRVVLQKDQSGQLESFTQKLTKLKRRED